MKPETQNALTKIDQYLKEGTAIGVHLGRMLEIEARLSGYFAYLAQEEAKAQTQLNFRYWQRKIGYSREQIKARAAGAKSVADSENKALEKIQDEINAEIEATGDFELLKGYCRGIEKVLISLRNRIRHDEAEMARKTQQVR